MEESSGDLSKTLANDFLNPNPNPNPNSIQISHGCDRGSGKMKGTADDEEEFDGEVWETLSTRFDRVQSVLDQNSSLIRQVNENHQSKIPDNLVKNVALIREINSNISKDKLMRDCLIMCCCPAGYIE